MARLSSLDHELLTDEIVRIFDENNVRDVIDFLEHDEDEMVNFTKLSYSNIANIRQRIIDKFNVAPVTGLQLYEEMKKSPFISTGIPRLDIALNGGLPPGKIIEICGLPNSGKTQLSLIISCKISQILKQNIIYIDTKNDFSGSRVYQILKESKLTENELVFCLERIRVVRIWNMNELISFMYDLHNKEELRRSVSIIVIDSLPCLMLQHQGENSKESIGLLNMFVNVARLLGNEYRISVLVINLITRWKEAPANEEDVENTEWIQKKIPTLGKYWQCIPHLYIQTDIDSDDPLKKLQIMIKKSCDAVYSDIMYFEFCPNGLK